MYHSYESQFYTYEFQKAHNEVFRGKVIVSVSNSQTVHIEIWLVKRKKTQRREREEETERNSKCGKMFKICVLIVKFLQLF